MRIDLRSVADLAVIATTAVGLLVVDGLVWALSAVDEAIADLGDS